MARTLIASDDFNRAGPSLGSNWANLNTLSRGDVLINSSTRAAGEYSGSAGEFPAARWVGAGTFTDDQYSSITMLNCIGAGSSAYIIGVIVRASADTYTARDYYEASVQVDPANPLTTTLKKWVNGTATVLHSATVTWANNDVLSLEAEGTTLRVCKNGTPLGGSFTQTDSSLTTGKPGITLAASIYGDDWEGGNVSAASTTHAATGALTAGAATVSGSAVRNATHTSSGALAAGAAVVAGTANHLTSHAATGTLTAGAATVAGTAARTGAVVSFTTEAFMNNTETPLASTAVDWEWHAGGVIGSAVGTVTNGSGTTNGSGVLVATGMTAGAGYLLATDGVGHVYYEEGTAA